MSLLNDLKNVSQLTERENDIRSYFLSHPEHIADMSCRDIGEATYTSASSVTRFCQKFGCKGYPDFKVRFLSDVKDGQILDDPASVQISERENIDLAGEVQRGTDPSAGRHAKSPFLILAAAYPAAVAGSPVYRLLCLRH